ncbi:hypothetical protein GCM10014713_55570 [Streptomyces purpureus]|uniref:Uncharacterized protein n=1 Tax=Streptomyces purpureus TaxID=1951 RepID=A0A918LV70_9ACTN|nr:hypothetical protein GCM10014713_55570 [Streptomyces purpureus]
MPWEKSSSPVGASKTSGVRSYRCQAATWRPDTRTSSFAASRKYTGFVQREVPSFAKWVSCPCLSRRNQPSLLERTSASGATANRSVRLPAFRGPAAVRSTLRNRLAVPPSVGTRSTVLSRPWSSASPVTAVRIKGASATFVTSSPPPVPGRTA